ncbi:hypothetical protein HWC66_gp29 [Gordonia phage Chikenjars]|uniref:Uncharacterized protein n=2 Tax=Kenoshavirus TaxID=2842796 RepID=A0A410TCE1_9CAUD|nr:hypothetical protein HWC06_gp29 [Gordonia phage Duffington]YP_009852131.1 hypothetical protein HWC66_gp29 [Gordonia phage Chikenjars]QAU06735.1 hypothetical protein SEA_DUFFINGTON_29 [Gordonia phage Duffington]QEQ94332.1 hypothetical protein SEA_CHIKENJARS_29 [Gordonia phage Chikenjars]
MIKVGTRNAGEIVDPTRVAKVVLARHPSGQVREAYPVHPYAEKGNDFSVASDIGFLPLSIMEESNMLGATITNGLYKPRVTNVNAKHIRLCERMYDGNELTVQFTVADLQPIVRPSSVILGANVYGQDAIEVLFGSDGFRIQVTDYENIVSAVYPFTYALANNDVVTVKRLLDIIVIHVNGSYVFAARDPLLKPNDSQTYVGVRTTSTATGISSAFSSLKFIGSTFQADQLLVRFDVERKVLPQNTATLVGSFYSAQGGHALLMLNEFGWTNWTNFSVRQVEVNVNGVQQLLITNQNGGSTSKELTLPPNSLFEIKAISNAGNASDRTIKEGLFEVYPY